MQKANTSEGVTEGWALSDIFAVKKKLEYIGRTKNSISTICHFS